MLFVPLALLAAAPVSPQAQQFADQMCEYYAQVLDGAKAGDAAAKTNDFTTAHSRWAGAQQQLEQGSSQLARAKEAGVFPDHVKMKCAAGRFTGASLAKAFAAQAKALAAKATKAEAQAKSGAWSDAQKTLALASIGKTLDGAEALEKEATAAVKTGPAKAAASYERASKAYQWILDVAAQVTANAKLTAKDTVPTKGGALKLPAVVKRAQADQKRAGAALAAARTAAGKQAALAQAKLAAKPAPAARPAPVAAPPEDDAPPDVSEPPPLDPPTEEEEGPSEKAVAIDYVTAATFAAGRCSFGNCAKDGWESNGSTSRCNFGNCLTDGWETRHPDGRVSQTRCSFNDCLKDGWDTTHPDGKSSSTRCNFGNCATDGWDTSTPLGTASTRCSFGKCLTDGWETSLPTGGSVTCRCSFGDCLKDGAECN